MDCFPKAFRVGIFICLSCLGPDNPSIILSSCVLGSLIKHFLGSELLSGDTWVGGGVCSNTVHDFRDSTCFSFFWLRGRRCPVASSSYSLSMVLCLLINIYPITIINLKH